MGERHIRLLAPLAFLSPRIIAAIADGTAPADLTVTGLANALPYSWAEQERRIGLHLYVAPACGRSSNRSLATVEPVSPPRNRKLEKSEQRPAPETRTQRTEIPEVVGQRLVPAGLTCGNVDAFPYWGKFTSETALPG